MLIRTSLRQARRAPVRMAACFVLMAMVCAFLTVGLNLRQAAQRNLERILDSFDVVARPSFQARIDTTGRLYRGGEQELAGYFPCVAENYDLEPLETLPGVTSVDVRNQFGAWVRGQEEQMSYALNYFQAGVRYLYHDVVIFELLFNTPKTVAAYSGTTPYEVKILWSAMGKTTNNLMLGGTRREDFLLEPGKRYIAIIGEIYVLGGDAFHYPMQVYVYPNGTQSLRSTLGNIRMLDADPFPIQEYFDGFFDTPTGQYFRQAAEVDILNNHSLTAVTTSDLSAMNAWAEGYVRVTSGREFTQEEYDTGARVCLVSEAMAELMKWKVGDQIDFGFYPTRYALTRRASSQTSAYDPSLFASTPEELEADLPLSHVFYEDSYTIVGLYGGQVRHREENDYPLSQGIDRKTVIFPSASIENQPSPQLTPDSVTLRLEPLSLHTFLAAVQSSGLMDPQPDGYQLSLTVEDHGLSGMLSGLQSLIRISRLTVMLSVIAAGLTVATLAVLHLLQSRRQIASLRSLGVRRGQAAFCAACGMLAVCLLGAALGAWAGNALSEQVAGSILEQPETEYADIAFSSMLQSSEEEQALTAESDPALALLSGICVFGALALCALLLDGWEAGKPPMRMLGAKE